MEERAEKRCGRCGIVKPLTEFTRKGKRGRQSYCRPCVSAYFQEYYRQNKAAYIARANERLKRIKALIREAKDKPCLDCARRFPYYMMEFDHREGEIKLYNISELNSYRRTSKRKLLAEIAKCDLVCANCHRE